MRPLVLFLRCMGTLDLLACVVVFLPREAIGLAHETLGLGPLPAGPIVGYLVRSTSLLYALHGALILYLASDVERHRGLIRMLAWLAIAHGALLAYIDTAEGMPGWWRLLEGPAFALTGGIVLWLQRQAGPP